MFHLNNIRKFYWLSLGFANYLRDKWGDLSETLEGSEQKASNRASNKGRFESDFLKILSEESLPNFGHGRLFRVHQKMWDVNVLEGPCKIGCDFRRAKNWWTCCCPSLLPPKIRRIRIMTKWVTKLRQTFYSFIYWRFDVKVILKADNLGNHSGSRWKFPPDSDFSELNERIG